MGKTPSLKVKCPTCLGDVIDRFESESGRVKDDEKMSALCDVPDVVFQDQVDEFYWDLRDSVQTEQYPKYEFQPPESDPFPPKRPKPHSLRVNRSLPHFLEVIEPIGAIL